MFTDTHCHIFDIYYENKDLILAELEAHGIKRIIINGFDYKSNLEVLSLVAKYNNVYGAIGVHPDNLSDDFEKCINIIEQNINNPKILAIGEIGLDYYHNSSNKEKQITCFKRQLDLAKKYHKPVIIHNRKASDDMISILQEYNLKGIIHCFSENYQFALKYIQLGLKLGINGLVTFKNSDLPSVLEQIPIENILLETDCPYITPEPYRKLKNEPKYLLETVKTVASIYKTDEYKLANVLEHNLKEVFDNF